MSDLHLELTAVDEPPAPKRKAGGGAGRVSPFSVILDQVKAQPDKWFRLTAEALDEAPKNVKASSAARRIHEGKIRGVQAGEFESVGREGHVYAAYRGQAGIDAWAAGEPERQAESQRRAAAKAAKAQAKLNDAGASAPALSDTVAVTDGADVSTPAASVPGVEFSESGW